MDKMFYSSPQALVDLGVDVHMESKVTHIDFDKKEVTYIQNNQEHKVTYENLILATGSVPIVPPFGQKYTNKDNVFLCKNYDHAMLIQEMIKKADKKEVAIIGGGYIGVELVESFVANGFKTTLVEAE